MRDFLTCLTCVLAMPAASAVAGPRFIDRAAEQSFTHQYTGSWEHFVGGGLSAFDCNTDGFSKVFASGGESQSVLLINRTEHPGAPLRFEAAETDDLVMTGVTGAYPLDIDGDAVMDLALLRVGENRLYRGLGDCRFQRANEGWDFHGRDGWTTAFSAVWENGKTLPTLAFGNYVDRDDPEGPFSACDDNWLYRPEGASYAPSQGLSPGYCALSMQFSEFGDEAGLATTHRARGAAVVDLNRDGRLDIVVNNRRAGLELNENVTAGTGHWLAVELHQPGANRQAVGGGHAGGAMGFHHFGTGEAVALRIRVVWPDGLVSPWHDVDADQHVRVEREGRTAQIVPSFPSSMR